MRFIPLLLLLSAPSVLIAAEPLKAILVAPHSAEAGTDLFLDASQSEGTIQHYLWRVTPERPGKKQIDTSKDKQKPRLMTYPGKWTVELLIVSEDGEQSRCYQTIDIPGAVVPCPEPDPQPKPDPTPGPTPIPPRPDPGPQPVPPTPDPPKPPDPVVPAGEFGIAPKIADATKTTPLPERTKLADACDVLAAQIAAGTLKDPQKLLNEIAVAAKAIPAFAAIMPKIQGVLQETYAAHKNGRLKVNVGVSGASMADPSGWQQLLKECSIGLKALK